MFKPSVLTVAAGFLILLPSLSIAKSHKHAAKAKCNSLVLLSASGLEAEQKVVSEIKKMGGRAVHGFDHAILAYLPPDAKEQLGSRMHTLGIDAIHHDWLDPSSCSKYGEETVTAVAVWNGVFTEKGRKKRKDSAPKGRQRKKILFKGGDNFRVPDEVFKEELKKPFDHVGGSPPWGAGYYDQTEYFLGDPNRTWNLVVSILRPESRGGSGDESSTEDWTGLKAAEAVTHVTLAVDWWVDQFPPDVEMSIRYHTPSPVSLKISAEPINHPPSDESSWITQTINAASLGQTDCGTLLTDHWGKVYCHNDRFRTRFNTDWAFTVFVVNSENDSDGLFAADPVTGRKELAYAYGGGPFLVMSTKSGGLQMRFVCAHEIGHIFYAADEYPGASSSIAEAGYLKVQNLNHVDAGVGVGCIMRGDTETAFLSNQMCTFTRQMVGWFDTDGDGAEDITDQQSGTTLNAFLPNPTVDSTPTYTGNSTVIKKANENPRTSGISGHPRNDIQVNRIERVQFSINGGATFSDAQPADGVFDGGSENFVFTTPSLTFGQTHTICARAINSTNNKNLDIIQGTPIPCDLLLVDDSTPPTPVIIQDDGDFTGNFTLLHATWSSEDPDTGIASFEYAIGTSPGATDVVGFTNVGSNVGVVHSGLSLVDAQIYFFTVRVTNGAGLIRVGVSDGITVSRGFFKWKVTAKVKEFIKGDLIPFRSGSAAGFDAGTKATSGSGFSATFLGNDGSGYRTGNYFYFLQKYVQANISYGITYPTPPNPVVEVPFHKARQAELEVFNKTTTGFSARVWVECDIFNSAGERGFKFCHFFPNEVIFPWRVFQVGTVPDKLVTHTLTFASTDTLNIGIGEVKTLPFTIDFAKAPGFEGGTLSAPSILLSENFYFVPSTDFDNNVTISTSVLNFGINGTQVTGMMDVREGPLSFSASTPDGIASISSHSPGLAVVTVPPSDPRLADAKAAAAAIGLAMDGALYEIVPAGLNFSRPATLVLRYTEPLSPGVSESSLSICQFSDTEGWNCLPVASRDILGNKITTGITFTGLYAILGPIVESTPPVTTLSFSGPAFLSPDGKLFTSGETRYVLSATDPLVSGVASGVKLIEFRVDGGQFKEFTLPLILAEGEHLIEFRARDNAGNVESLKSRVVNVDKTSPISNVLMVDGFQIRITDERGEEDILSAMTFLTVASGETKFKLSRTDLPPIPSGIEKVEYRVDGEEDWRTQADVSQPINVGSFAEPSETFQTDGFHSVVTRATDNVGNVGEERTLIVFIDRTPPEVLLTKPLDGERIKRKQDVEGTATDARLDFYKLEFSIAGTTNFADIQSRSTFTEQVEAGLLASWFTGDMFRGAYTLRLTAQDLVRNVSVVTASDLIKRGRPGLVVPPLISLPTFVQAIGEKGRASGQMRLPVGVAVGSGRLYVTDTQNHRVEVFNTDAGLEFEFDFGRHGHADGNFAQPEGAVQARKPAQRLYVADRYNNRIQVFDAQGTPLLTFGSEGSADGQFNQPSALAVDAVGNVYVADTMNHRVQIFESDGTFKTVFGRSGTGEGEFDQPVGIAVDAGGTIFVADRLNSRIQVFSAQGSFLRVLAGARELKHPVGVALSPEPNELYVADTGHHKVVVLDKETGKVLGRFGGFGAGEGRFHQPRGLVWDTQRKLLYVADTHNNRVQVFGFVEPTIVAQASLRPERLVLSKSAAAQLAPVELALENLVVTPIPFGPRIGETLEINFILTRVAKVTVLIYDKQLNSIKRFSEQTFGAGAGQVFWDGVSDRAHIVVPSGAYVLTVIATDGVKVVSQSADFSVANKGGHVPGAGKVKSPDSSNDRTDDKGSKSPRGRAK